MVTPDLSASDGRGGGVIGQCRRWHAQNGRARPWLSQLVVYIWLRMTDSSSPNPTAFPHCRDEPGGLFKSRTGHVVYTSAYPVVPSVEQVEGTFFPQPGRKMSIQTFRLRSLGRFNPCQGPPLAEEALQCFLAASQTPGLTTALCRSAPPRLGVKRMAEHPVRSMRSCLTDRRRALYNVTIPSVKMIVFPLQPD